MTTDQDKFSPCSSCQTHALHGVRHFGFHNYGGETTTEPGRLAA